MPSCIAAVAECIEILIARVDKHIKQRLFDITLMLNNDKKPAVREMAATLLSRFISVEKTSFLPRINILFPILVTFLNSNTFKQPGHSAIMSISKKSVVNRESFSLDEKNIYIRKEKEKATDHELIQIQNCILKILEFFSDSILVHAEWNESIDKLIFECQNLLGYEHEWVRLNAVKIIRHIFSHIDYELVTNILTKKTKINESDISFLYVTPENSIKNLTLDLCAQMVPGKTSELLAEEITNIFLIFANILKAVQLMSNAKNTTATYNESHTRCKLNLNWLLRRMRYIVQAEISKAPHSFILRKFVFNFYEGLITILDVNIIQELAVSILSPLVREMVEDDQNIHPELNQQSCRIGSRLRKKIGSVVYDKLRAELQTKLLLKRTLRKKEIAIAKVLNPIKAVKRKKSVLKKKEISKKRKIDVIKGKVAGKKRKRKNDELF
ncbi:uncharacterized protein LOC129615671 [Condylostylus longicornis]|uniref:uncharacterized protein LOC129615671 n=1 Tax=Condylostylus longicornis TaxID=2530218 RepID=UPI00244DE2A8|nr:uncharacterized protein LOC129615671 [Condylostylus longicornis]